MADLDHSTEDTSGDSRDDNNSHQGSELQFSEDEETLIIRMFNLVGERFYFSCFFFFFFYLRNKIKVNLICGSIRWSLIAGRIPGRTAEEIEKYWNSRYSTSQ
ncbi:MYB-like transcription factor ETC1 isoform X1 [Camellia sinensis]|nr:MYB-like transcription factor ETC1 isoform X1 [Camellia sinensis]